MNHLTIITPCARPENLPALARSIDTGRRLFTLTWWVVVDGCAVHQAVDADGAYVAYLRKPGSKVGNAQRNYALDKIADGWVCFLDDDNIIHPDLFPTIADWIDQTDASAFCFPQVGNPSPSTAFALPALMKPNHVDLAQVVIKRELIGSHRFIEDAYNADGQWIEAIYNAQPEAWAFLRQPLCYYNKLRG